jgi:hypothetical protein
VAGCLGGPLAHAGGAEQGGAIARQSRGGGTHGGRGSAGAWWRVAAQQAIAAQRWARHRVVGEEGVHACSSVCMQDSSMGKQSGAACLATLKLRFARYPPQSWLAHPLMW